MLDCQQKQHVSAYTVLCVQTTPRAHANIIDLSCMLVTRYVC